MGDIVPELLCYACVSACGVASLSAKNTRRPVYGSLRELYTGVLVPIIGRVTHTAAVYSV